MRTLAKKQAEFFGKLRNAPCNRHIEMRFLYAAAPVLRRAKSAALLKLHRDCHIAWREMQNSLRQVTGLATHEIVGGQGTILLFIYDEVSMGRILQDRQNAALLSGYGYHIGCSSKEALTYLQHRFRTTHFPHEIGVFLGYPTDDVIGFITNKGKDFILCHHWKVYHDLDRAQELFRKIDEAQENAMSLLVNEAPIHIAAKLLKAI